MNTEATLSAVNSQSVSCPTWCCWNFSIKRRCWTVCWSSAHVPPLWSIERPNRREIEI